jgi:hypothetical protein
MKMRTVGQRRSPPITESASARLLVDGCRFNDELHRWSPGNAGGIRKGVYRFMTHAEANRHALGCVAEEMVRRVKAARNDSDHI